MSLHKPEGLEYEYLPVQPGDIEPSKTTPKGLNYYVNNNSKFIFNT